MVEIDDIPPEWDKRAAEELLSEEGGTVGVLMVFMAVRLHAEGQGVEAIRSRITDAFPDPAERPVLQRNLSRLLRLPTR